MLFANKAGKRRFVTYRQNGLGINILLYYKVEITKVFSSKMVNEFIFKDVCWFMIYRDLKKSDNRPYNISPKTDVSVAENGPMLSNRVTVHLYISSSHLY